MAISAYPRTAVQNSKSNTNKPNGLSLMIVDPVTGEYTPATAATFAGGGGGDAATATNQQAQIAQSDSLFIDPNTNAPLAASLYNSINSLTPGDSLGVIIDYLNSILAQLIQTNSTLENVDANITNGQQRVVIQDTSGNTANVSSGENALFTLQV